MYSVREWRNRHFTHCRVNECYGCFRPTELSELSYNLAVLTGRNARALCRFAFVLFSSLVLTALAQSASPTSPTNLGAGFILKSRYTNRFFGFVLPLPRELTFSTFRIPFKDEPSRYFVFGVQTITTASISPLKPKLSLLLVSAKKSANAEDLHDAAAEPNGPAPTKIEVAGREFWTSEFEEKVAEGTEHHVAFATKVPGYILQFNIESFDKKVTAKLRNSILHIEFVDPATVQAVGGPDAPSSQ